MRYKYNKRIRESRHLFVSVAAIAAIYTGCSVFPDSFSVGSRVDRYGHYDSTTFTVLYHNPWKPRQVHEEYVTTDGGMLGGELP